MTQAPPPTWSRVKSILADALELPSEEQEGFLDRACAGHPGLRERVSRLIRAYSATPSLSEADAPVQRRAAFPEPEPGTHIGRYRIVRLIGRGGMGCVYEALDEQLSRPVAIKVLHSHAASRSMLRRFELEPRLLARLRHPGIAQIFETGVLPDAGGDPAPFFAMELVTGASPITDYARAHSLSLQACLALFITVCDAVTHGHQRGVIHRDLKPANILIDSSGQPKIIDFGIGRMTDPESSHATVAGELLGTLRYMSPEQFGDGTSAIDVRTDVYALGVVLYELLAGAPPQPDPEGGVLGSVLEARRRRPAPLSSFRPDLSGDLETVALKAVEPEPRDRYQSVAEFAADLERILRHEPVSARPHSAIYQLRMFARRHRALVAGMVAIALTLALGTAGTTVGMLRALRAERAAVAQTRRAQRLSDFLANTIRSADPQVIPTASLALLDPRVYPLESWMGLGAVWGSAGPTDVGVAGVLRHAAEHLDTQFGDDPDLYVQVSLLLARTLAALEDSATALRLADTALRLQLQSLSPDDPAVILTRYNRARYLSRENRPAEVEQELGLAIESASRRLGPLDPRTLEMQDFCATTIAGGRAQPDRAIAMERELLEAVSRDRGADSAAAWMRHVGLIAVLVSNPDRELIVRECRATIDGLTRTIGPDIAPVASVCWSLAGTLGDRAEDLPEAEALERRAISIVSRIYGPDSGALYEQEMGLASVLMRQHKLADAETVARETVASSMRMIGPRSIYTLKAKARLARILTWEQHEPEEAERLARETAEGYLSVAEPAEDYASYHAGIFAAALRLRGQPARAETMLRDTLSLRGSRAIQRGGAWVEAYLYLQLALCLADQHRPEEAAATIRTARTWAEQLNDPLHPVLLNIQEVQPALEGVRKLESEDRQP